MPLYRLEVTGAQYVDTVIDIEADDPATAFVMGDDQLADWDEIHSRMIVAVGNIAVEPMTSHDYMDEIEAAYSLESDIIDPPDLPAPGDLVEELVNTVNEEPLGDVDFFIDEDGEQVVVEVEDYDASENEGGVSVKAYEQDGEGV